MQLLFFINLPFNHKFSLFNLYYSGNFLRFCDVFLLSSDLSFQSLLAPQASANFQKEIKK